MSRREMKFCEKLHQPKLSQMDWWLFDFLVEGSSKRLLRSTYLRSFSVIKRGCLAVIWVKVGELGEGRQYQSSMYYTGFFLDYV